MSTEGTVMKTVTPLLLGLLTFCTWSFGTDRVQLQNGFALEGEILSQNEDRVVIDMGFSVLTLPKSSVLEIAALNEGAPAVMSDQNALFSSGGASKSSTVNLLADKVGHAVVLIQTPTSLGSGFIINKDGYVVTNQHVIAGEHRLTVTLFERDGGELIKKQFENVRIVATHPDADLALIQLMDDNGREFPFVPIGDSESLEAGQVVFAIGNPLGLERTVSQGIISIKNRQMDGRLYIQTTTEINPGNSGGPLFNLYGEVIGVNNMKAASVGVEGLGFSIPVTTLKDFLLNREAFAFDPQNPNAGYRYYSPVSKP